MARREKVLVEDVTAASSLGEYVLVGTAIHGELTIPFCRDWVDFVRFCARSCRSWMLSVWQVVSKPV